MEEAGRGQAVGEVSLLTGEPRAATIRAVRDSDLLRLSRAGLRHAARASSARDDDDRSRGGEAPAGHVASTRSVRPGRRRSRSSRAATRGCSRPLAERLARQLDAVAARARAHAAARQRRRSITGWRGRASRSPVPAASCTNRWSRGWRRSSATTPTPCCARTPPTPSGPGAACARRTACFVVARAGDPVAIGAVEARARELHPSVRFELVARAPGRRPAAVGHAALAGSARGCGPSPRAAGQRRRPASARAPGLRARATRWCSAAAARAASRTWARCARWPRPASRSTRWAARASAR